MKLVISASPHIDSGATTRKIMGDVLIALCPALIAAIVIFGWRALLVTAVCAASEPQTPSMAPWPKSSLCLENCLALL